VSQSERLVVTRGAEGASVYRGEERFEVPACPAAAVDTTGAGDTFATAFILASSRLRLDDVEAARLASAYAAAGVERVGPAPLPPLSEIERRAAIAAGSA
jgi:sugar/nucleoside kinase (ribokinase family)